MKKFVVGLWVCLVICGSLSAAEEELIPIVDLRQEWLIFDQKNNVYLPLIDNDLEDVIAVNFSVDPDIYKNYYLYIHTPAGTSLFINQKIIDYSENKKEWLMNIDSLRSIYHSQGLFFTLYIPNVSDDVNLITAIVRPASENNVGISGLSDFSFLSRRAQTIITDFFVFGLVMLLIMYAIIVNLFFKKLSSFYDLSRTLSLNIREEVTFKGKIFDGANTPILIAYSFLLSYIGIILIHFLEIYQLPLRQFGMMALSWMVLAFLIFLFFILKYWLLLLVGGLFKLPIVNRHYLEYLRISKIFFTLIFIFILVAYFAGGVDIGIIGKWIRDLIIIFLILRVLLLYFKFIRSSSFTNLYLFSYLCSTEILPMVVGLKILLD